MKILVANLGSTSFKYRLFDMTTERQLARGGVERIGSAESRCFVEIGDYRDETTMSIPVHGVAVEACIAQLTDPKHGCISSASEIVAIGFKAVHGGRMSGVQRIDSKVLAAMDEMNSVAPAHNPPYMAAMKQLASMSSIPLVAAFETDFHQTIPEASKRYALPSEIGEALPIRKWGFHGASHRYIAGRTMDLLRQSGFSDRSNARIVSCHLGGSSSLCAIRNGQSIATTMGMSPQTGLPQNNRVGDFDPYAIPLMMQHTGMTLEQLLHHLSIKGGLLGLSGGLSGDIRDLEEAADQGNDKAKLAIEVYISEIRRQLGGMMIALGGLDAIVFTGGIGENGIRIRQSICEGLEEFGIRLSDIANQQRSVECRIDDSEGKVQIWIVPTNEEIVVARQTVAAIQAPSG